MEMPVLSLRTNERNIFDDYILADLLGSGSYSQVRLAKHKATAHQYAIKVRVLRYFRLLYNFWQQLVQSAIMTKIFNNMNNSFL